MRNFERAAHGRPRFFALNLQPDVQPVVNPGAEIPTLASDEFRAAAMPAGSRNRQPLNSSRMEYAGTAWV
jgi:hypothetical protein